MSSVVISGDSSGTITLQAPAVSGSTTINLPATSGTATVMPTGYTLGAGNTSSFKNRIINGDMRIDQRNAGASVTPTNGQFLVDRWVYYASQASKMTAQQNQGSVTSPVGFINYQGLTSSSAYTVGSSETFVIRQAIEGLNVQDFAWGTANAKTVTLSAWVYSSLTGTFGGSVGNSAANRSYPFTYSIPTANTWTQINVTIPGDTSGTWLTTNGIGIQLYFSMGTGTTLSGTANSWAGSTYYSATGATSVVGTNGAKFYITGVQLEVDSTATSFDYRDFGRELILCQRYYEITKFVSLGSNYSNSYPQMTYRVTKRTSPTITFSDNGGAFTPAYDQNGFYQNSQNTNNVAFAVNVLSSAEL